MTEYEQSALTGFGLSLLFWIVIGISAQKIYARVDGSTFTGPERATASTNRR